jgi:broad specificity phosphatase PhoE
VFPFSAPIAFPFSRPITKRAVQTASLVVSDRCLRPQTLESLTECDLGRWEGLDWPTIREQEPEAYTGFLTAPGHPGGESYREVHSRVTMAVEELLERHRGESVLVVSHHVVLRTYLAGLLGLPPDRAREVSIPNCSISTVVQDGAQTRILSLADTRHLAGLENEAKERTDPFLL